VQPPWLSGLGTGQTPCGLNLIPTVISESLVTTDNRTATAKSAVMNQKSSLYTRYCVGAIDAEN